MTEQASLQTVDSDEIDLKELFGILWKGKWIIIGITFVFAIASVAYALYLPNEYKSTAIVAPSEQSSGGKLGALASQFGGLASLAGINLGGGESNDTVIAMEVMKTWGFAEDFIQKHELDVDLFAAKGWNQSSNTLMLDDELYNVDSNKWVREAPKGKTVEPTSWELYEEFADRFAISQSKDSGLISISVTHYSPVIAKEWVDLLVQDINNLMKSKALEESESSINYLNEQMALTSVAEIRTVFAQLIQEQHKTKMLAQVSDEYVFKVVSEAKVAEEKAKPKRAIIVILGTLLGGFLSVLITFGINFLRNNK